MIDVWYWRESFVVAADSLDIMKSAILFKSDLFNILLSRKFSYPLHRLFERNTEQKYKIKKSLKLYPLADLQIGRLTLNVHLSFSYFFFVSLKMEGCSRLARGQNIGQAYTLLDNREGNLNWRGGKLYRRGGASWSLSRTYLRICPRIDRNVPARNARRRDGRHLSRAVYL